MGQSNSNLYTPISRYIVQVQTFPNEHRYYRMPPQYQHYDKTVYQSKHQQIQLQSLHCQKRSSQQLQQKNFGVFFPSSLGYPFSAIGIVKSKYKNHVYQGTAFLVQPNIAMTAAQNVVQSSGQIHSGITFFVANIAKRFQVFQVYYPKQYLKKGKTITSNQHNYAVLKIHNQSGIQLSWLKLSFEQSKTNNGYRHIFIEYSSYQIIKQIKMMHLFDDLSYSQNSVTPTAQYGSPVIIQKELEFYVVGIKASQSFLFNENIKNQLNLWLKDSKYGIDFSKIRITKGNQKSRNCITNQITSIIDNSMQHNIVFLYSNLFTDRQLKKVCDNQWNNLGILELSNQIAQKQQYCISDEGVRYLSLVQLPNLIHLSLDFNIISDQGARYMSKANWNKLRLLDLHSNKISDEGVRYLSQTKWPHLIIIYLNNNLISDAGVQYLIDTECWPSITKILLIGNQTSQSMGEYIHNINHHNKKRQKIAICVNIIRQFQGYRFIN